MSVLVDLEEFGFEDVKDFERFERLFNNLHELYIKKKQENQALKDRWQELKKWFNTHYELNLKAKDKDADTLKYILDKMQELEKGGN